MLIPCEKCAAMISHRAKFCSECGATRAPKAATATASVATAATKDARKKRITRGILLSTLFAVPFWLAMYFFVFSGDGCSKAQGTLTARALPKAGDFAFTPKLCKSGQHMSFHGVALFEKKGADPIVTVVTSHLEPTYVLLDPPSCGKSCRVKLTSKECARFLVAVERTSTTVNDIRLLDGHLSLTCKLAGGSVSADLKFESCD